MRGKCLLVARSPRVFLSYSHDSVEHSDMVLALANQFRADGIDAILDQYTPAPVEGWPRWTDRQIRDADFVLLICSESLRLACEGLSMPGTRHGVIWEGNLIYQQIYNSASTNQKFIPLLLGAATESSIPAVLQGITRYHLKQPFSLADSGYLALYRYLTDQQEILPPKLGMLRALEKRERKTAAVSPKQKIASEGSQVTESPQTEQKSTASGKVQSIELHDLQNALHKHDGKTVFVVFHASWSAPCRQLLSLISQISSLNSKKSHIYKSEVSDAFLAQNQLDIKLLPTILIYRDGEIQDRIIGNKSLMELQALINKYSD